MCATLVHERGGVSNILWNRCQQFAAYCRVQGHRQQRGGGHRRQLLLTPKAIHDSALRCNSRMRVLRVEGQQCILPHGLWSTSKHCDPHPDVRFKNCQPPRGHARGRQLLCGTDQAWHKSELSSHTSLCAVLVYKPGQLSDRVRPTRNDTHPSC